MPPVRELIRRVETFLGFGLLRYQFVLVGIALATTAVFWILQGSASFVDTLIFTLVIGNFTMIMLAATGDLYERSTPLREWAVFLAVLVPVGIVGGVLASLTIYYMHHPAHSLRLGAFLLVNVRFGLLVTVLVGISLFAVNSTRERLEAANRQLQDQVQLGEVKLQDQAAELATAHEIQAHLLPTNLPQVAGLQVSGAWQPARAVGGDYFDVVPFGRRRLGLTIADVSGKGMGAALLMANLQAAFRAFATEEVSPAEMCARLNRALCSSIAPGKFVTFFYAVIDAGELVLRYENAGHNPPILLRGREAVELEGGGTVLGLFPETPYADRSVPMRAGDCLLLFTDGITEAAQPGDPDDEFGTARLVDAARTARGEGAHGMRAKILEEVTRFCGGHFQDDASLIVLTIDERG